MSLRSAVKLNKIDINNKEQTVLPVTSQVKEHKIEKTVEQVPEIIKTGILNDKRNSEKNDQKFEKQI